MKKRYFILFLLTMFSLNLFDAFGMRRVYYVDLLNKNFIQLVKLKRKPDIDFIYNNLSHDLYPKTINYCCRNAAEQNFFYPLSIFQNDQRLDQGVRVNANLIHAVHAKRRCVFEIFFNRYHHMITPRTVNLCCKIVDEKDRDFIFRQFSKKYSRIEECYCEAVKERDIDALIILAEYIGGDKLMSFQYSFINAVVRNDLCWIEGLSDQDWKNLPRRIILVCYEIAMEKGYGNMCDVLSEHSKTTSRKEERCFDAFCRFLWS